VKYLVTGGAGFIGSHLVDRLITEDHKVTVVDNFINGRKENLQQHGGNENLKIFCQSITEDLTDVFGKVEYDCVFHLAALPRLEFSIDYPIEAHNVNINGTLNLLQACRSFGAKRFIFSSSSSIYGKQKKQPLTEDMVASNFLVPYALQKITGEHYCKLYFQLYGLKTIVLRYFSVYGPRQNPASPYSQLIARSMARAIKNDPKDRPFITGDGNQARAFTFVSDVVEANILASKVSEKSCLGEPFNVGNPSEVTVNQVIKKILTISKSKLKPEYRPARIEPAHILPDVTKSKKFLGWEAKISFDEGIEKVYQSFLQG
jgi:UDP-glucose 4-epimerase